MATVAMNTIQCICLFKKHCMAEMTYWRFKAHNKEMDGEIKKQSKAVGVRENGKWKISEDHHSMLSKNSLFLQKTFLVCTAMIKGRLAIHRPSALMMKITSVI